MKLRTMLSAALLVMLPLGPLCAQEKKGDHTPPPGNWLESYEVAVAAAKKDDKLAMLNFWFDG